MFIINNFIIKGIFGGKVSKIFTGLPKHYQANVNLGITYLLNWDDVIYYNIFIMLNLFKIFKYI